MSGLFGETLLSSGSQWAGGSSFQDLWDLGRLTHCVISNSVFVAGFHTTRWAQPQPSKLA